jgi:hypothetical protein
LAVLLLVTNSSPAAGIPLGAAGNILLVTYLDVEGFGVALAALFVRGLPLY